MLKPKSNAISEDYTINNKEILGSGINGKVITCIDNKTNEKYALKIIKDCEKARREIDLHWRACQGCKYICQIKDVYENKTRSKSLYLLVVMEFLDGGELFHQIIKRKDENPFTEFEVARIMYQICSAVKHLHDMDIAHRDLKPENLLLSTKDENAIIKLIDFGFAKESSSGLKTPCYTPYYVPPEILNYEKYDISCDIWSLGVIMYILCCGYPPFHSSHGKPISPGMEKKIRAGEYSYPEKEWKFVSQEAKDLIKHMIEINPRKRLTINQIMASNWISQYMNVPKTPLSSQAILREDAAQWPEIASAINIGLNELRADYSNSKLNDIGDRDDPVFKKRKEKITSTQITNNELAQIDNSSLIANSDNSKFNVK